MDTPVLADPSSALFHQENLPSAIADRQMARRSKEYMISLWLVVVVDDDDDDDDGDDDDDDALIIDYLKENDIHDENNKYSKKKKHLFQHEILYKRKSAGWQ